jgi:hypothetical protein
MNQESVANGNAFLAALSQKVSVGQVVEESPQAIAREIGIEEKLGVARAVRVLLSRGRIEQNGNGYKLLDTRPIELHEPVSVSMPRKVRHKAIPSPMTVPEPVPAPTMDQALIDRLVSLSAEIGQVRTELERAKTELDVCKRESIELGRRAAADRERARTLEDQLAQRG